MYPSHLIHFTRQHDPKTGKFTFGDGDGDGVSNDHKNQGKTSKEATEIFVMRALGQTLHSLYIDDYDERRAKNKELLEITNTKNWNK